ncbi:dopamine receptor 2 isoform X3 [Eurosta solidaginis]|uniref:dopamine receptor 2 isoform X3 n=1 Tax=Eurosta solidaginis TaxID=178769 RepID=UPI00353080EF
MNNANIHSHTNIIGSTNTTTTNYGNISYNATKNRNRSNTSDGGNSSIYFWDDASVELSEFSLVAPDLETTIQNLPAAKQRASAYAYEQKNANSRDNHIPHVQAEPPPPSSFYTSFNISDDIFDYFNSFMDSVEQQQKELSQTTSTIGSITSSITTADNAAIANSSLTSYIYSDGNGTQDLQFLEYFSLLPNDRISLLSFLFLFSFATVFGNALVILAVIRERYLHTATNYFIGSLAVADCLVGLVVMPFSALYEVLENTWFFGTDWCDIWRSLDVLFSTASILNLCVISLDRYWAITDPFSYPMRMTVKRSICLICAVWICSSAISFPAIIWWRAARDGEMPAYKCTFTEHLGYLIFSSTISFYLPLIVMVFTYCRIYRAAVIQTRSLKIGTKQVLMASGESQLTLRIHRGGTTRDPTTSSLHHPTIHGSLGGAPSGVDGSQHHRHHSHHHSSHHNHSATGTTSSTPEEQDDEPLSALHNNGLARHRHMGKNFSLSRKLAKFAKEKKAAKTLGIVMGVFIVCWLPFFVVNLLSGFCAECIEHEEVVSAIVTWLGWINSCMNPVIYACWSRDFRRAFIRLLCVCCPRKIRRKYQPTMRSKSQCQVAAAVVVASTPFSYTSVQQFDGERSII